jgi:hypothetical protein
MKSIKIVKNQEVKRRFTNVDFRNTKGSTWNTKRRFGL